MSPIVHVRHHAPCRHVPTRGRQERFTLVPAVTPVELREAERRDVALVLRHDLLGEIELHAIHGRMWIKPMPRQRPLRRADLVSFLEDRALLPHRLANPLFRHFSRTGLDPYDQTGLVHQGDRPRPEGTILEDGAERASRQMAAFLAGEVLLCEDEVYLGGMGPLERPLSSGVGTQLEPYPRFLASPYYSRVDRMDGLWRFLAGRAGPDAGFALAPWPGPWCPEMADIPGHLLRDDDLLLFANTGVGGVRGIVRNAVRHAAPETAARLDRLAEELLAVQREGLLWHVGPDQVEEVLVLCLAALREVGAVVDQARAREEAWTMRAPASRAADMAGYLEELLLPRVRDHAPLPEDDAASLSALGL